MNGLSVPASVSPLPIVPKKLSQAELDSLEDELKLLSRCFRYLKIHSLEPLWDRGYKMGVVKWRKLQDTNELKRLNINPDSCKGVIRKYWENVQGAMPRVLILKALSSKTSSGKCVTLFREKSRENEALVEMMIVKIKSNLSILIYIIALLKHLIY